MPPNKVSTPKPTLLHLQTTSLYSKATTRTRLELYIPQIRNHEGSVVKPMKQNKPAVNGSEEVSKSRVHWRLNVTEFLYIRQPQE